MQKKRTSKKTRIKMFIKIGWKKKKTQVDTVQCFVLPSKL